MNVGYSISKLKAMIESSNKGNVAYALDNVNVDELVQLKDLTNQNLYGVMVEFQGKLHMIGGNGYATRHEIYDDETNTWTLQPQLPFYSEKSVIVPHGDLLHVFGSDSSSYSTMHYIYDGTTWTKLQNISDYVSGGCGCVYDDYIYLVTTSAYIYSYNTTTGEFTRCTGDRPTSALNGPSMLVSGNTLAVFDSNQIYYFQPSKNTWTTTLQTTGINVTGKISVCRLDNNIYCCAIKSTSEGGKIYKLFGTTWTELCTCPEANYPSLVVHNNSLHVAPGLNKKTIYRYDYYTGIKGYVEQGTKVYYPINSYTVKGDLEVVDDGYIAKSSGSFIIANK